MDIEMESRSFSPLLTPKKLKELYPITDDMKKTVDKSRESIRRILKKEDSRILVIVGPCSIHCYKSAIDYVKRLKILSKKYGDVFFFVARIYLEKPRSTVGWKGYINDPNLDNSFQINKGLKLSRKLFSDICKLDMPIATEALDPNIPQYIHDLVSWTAIGARTTESQSHREMASGLNSPVGFKNSTEGNIDVSINAIISSSRKHHFIGLDDNGMISLIKSQGLKDSQIVLRGSKNGSNFHKESIEKCEQALEKHKLDSAIIVDCNHDNSGKDPSLQPFILENVVEQIIDGNKSIRGVMVESHILGGSQTLNGGITTLEYGKSITDKCLDWQQTEQCFDYLYQKIRNASCVDKKERPAVKSNNEKKVKS
jgi:3-deoxy-7-phosphoheptulonate synthase